LVHAFLTSLSASGGEILAAREKWTGFVQDSRRTACQSGCEGIFRIDMGATVAKSVTLDDNATNYHL
jgi:hypothetical protein